MRWEHQKVVEKVVEKPVDRVVEKVVEKIVEKPIYIDRIVEKPIYIDKNTDKPYPSNIGDFIPNGKQDFTALHFMVFLILVIVSILLFLFLIVFIKTLAAILNRIKLVFSKIAQCISEDDELAEIPSDFSDDSEYEKPTKKAAGKTVSKKKAAK